MGRSNAVSSPPEYQDEIRVGIDIGGTFTDFVIYKPFSQGLETFKLLSTPHNPAEAVLQGLFQIEESIRLSRGNPAGDGSQAGIVSIIHGSTVATNALLERKGAKTALITTEGFRDVLQIGRQDRPTLYDLRVSPPPPLVPDSLRMEVEERVDSRGQVLLPLNIAQLDRIVLHLKSREIKSVAVCLLFSFLHPDHEIAIASRLRSDGFFVSASHEVLPEYREYERTSTTVVNAYVSPILDVYLSLLVGRLGLDGSNEMATRIMQSNGGAISFEEAKRNGVHCILSGPAGGVVGCQTIGEAIYKEISTISLDAQPSNLRLITFDMGGTSTDVSLIDGKPHLTTEAVVGGCPIHIPILDIHTIGAGGGSIAKVDAGGALRVGPESAGADPGPACYGRAPLEDCQPTVTDANLVLGRLSPDRFLGGKMPLDPARADAVLSRLGEKLGLDRIQAALGIIEVANAHMERALRLISVERGHDPREFSLLSFGGAGGLHACSLARRLGIPRVIIPPVASTLSAFGMLAAEIAKDYSQTVMLAGDAPPDGVITVLDRMAAQGMAEVQAEGVRPEEITVHRFLDMRYEGQSYELTVPWLDQEDDEDPLQKACTHFHRAHQQAYGYNRPESPVVIVNARLRVVGAVPPPALIPLPLASPDPSGALTGSQRLYLSPVPTDVPVYQGEALQPGNSITGPALVIRSDTTVLIGQEDIADVDTLNNLILTIHPYNPSSYV